MAAVDQRYARALMDLVAEGKADAAVLQHELDDFAAMLQESQPLLLTLASPAVDGKEKLRLIDVLVERAKLSHLTRNFLAVVVDRGRIAAVPGIAREFEEMLLRQQGIVRAQVTSARSLTADEKAEIERELVAVTGQRIRATYGRDQQLIGGFVARVGDTVFDGSVRGRLQRLRATLMAQ